MSQFRQVKLETFTSLWIPKDKQFMPEELPSSRGFTDSDPSGSRATSYLNINMIEQEGFEIYNQITTLELWACYANVMTSVVRVYFQSWKLAF